MLIVICVQQFDYDLFWGLLLDALTWLVDIVLWNVIEQVFYITLNQFQPHRMKLNIEISTTTDTHDDQILNTIIPTDNIL